MGGIDQHIAHMLGGGASLALVLLVALLLGLRHASDPDHLAAVTALVATDPDGRRRAARLGLAWGAGHGTTLIVFGMPIILFRRYLPERVQQGAELAVGLVIMALALRLLWRWRSGALHAHAHAHGQADHLHLHDGYRVHEHPQLGRTARQAYGIGLVHGTGGSAGVGILLLAAIHSHAVAVAALVLFAGAAALSMSFLSSVFGYALTRGPVMRRLLQVTPALGVLSLCFGAYYALGAVGVVPYNL